MKHLLFFLLFAFSTQLSASETLEFTLSETHGLMNFIETIAGYSHRSKTLKEFFEKSPHNTPVLQKKLEEFREVFADLDQTVQFPGYPEDRHMSINIAQLFLIRSAYSNSLRDFQERTVGLVPMAVQNQYFNLLKYFQPIYREFIWKPNLKKLEQRRSQFKKIAKKAKVSEMFERAKTFYRSEWPAAAKFRLALVPIPGAKGEARSESLVAFESIGVLIDNSDHIQKFSIIFHELCHSLYESQSKNFQREFEQYFKNSKSPYARYSYHLMNEAVATALGNGWAYKRVKKELNSNHWYNHRYVENYARALFPLIESYLEKGKSLDEPFAKESIEILENHFPEALQDLENLLTHVTFIVDEKVLPLKTATRLFQNTFSVWSTQSHALSDTEAILKSFKNETNTTVVLVSSHNLKALDSLPEPIFKALNSSKDSLKDSKTKILTGFTEDASPFIVISSSNEEGFQKALAHLNEKKKIEKVLSVISIE